jgi:NAD+ synthase (glutamine-hydrolysing)
MQPFRLGLAQLNPTVGDLSGNVAKIVGMLGRASAMGVDLVAFPELVLPGYPPEDLLLMTSFVEANRAGLQEIAGRTQGITALVGYVDCDGGDIYNAAAVLHDGQVAAVYRKLHLPNYSVFDEYRYFQAGKRPLVFELRGTTIGVNVCEDIWYPAGPTELQSLAGARLVVNISASPYYAGKGLARERMLATRAADNVVFVAFCNLVGGQDELVFDGGSVIFDARGELLARARQFEEDLLVADLNLGGVFRQRLHDPRQRQERLPACEAVERVALALTSSPVAPPPLPNSGQGEGGREAGERAARTEPRLEGEAEVYHALVLGTRDYVRKNGFRQVVIALSGGIDSALTATIAADALGPENVVGVAMPSRYSSPASGEDAEQLARSLGLRFLTIPIDATFQAYLDMLAEAFQGLPPDVTEENVQARIRGNILMALSNKFGWLVLTTGNKSELAAGYCTLYGDMAGGFAVLKDVFKTRVYRLAHYRNSLGAVIPQRSLERPPTAELRPDQTDEDTLGPYATLDPILQAYVEEDRGLEEIVALGYDEAAVRRIIRMVDSAEYKRRQGAPGIKITPRAFGKDRRLPITNRYRR